jgi:hypothetical protein
MVVPSQLHHCWDFTEYTDAMHSSSKTTNRRRHTIVSIVQGRKSRWGARGKLPPPFWQTFKKKLNL